MAASKIALACVVALVLAATPSQGLGWQKITRCRSDAACRGGECINSQCTKAGKPEPEPQMCCRGMTASCKACTARQSVEAYCADQPNTVGCPQTKSCASLAAQANTISAQLKRAQASYQAALAQSKTVCPRFPATTKATCEASKRQKIASLASLKRSIGSYTAKHNQLKSALGACQTKPPAPATVTTTPEPETTRPGSAEATPSVVVDVVRCRTAADCTGGSKCFFGTCKVMPTNNFGPKPPTKKATTTEAAAVETTAPDSTEEDGSGSGSESDVSTDAPATAAPATTAAPAPTTCPAASVAMCAARKRDCKFALRGGKMRPSCVAKPKPATTPKPAPTTCPTASVAMCAARKRDCKFALRGGKMRPSCVAKPKPTLTQQQIECNKFAAQAKSIAARFKGAQASYQAALTQSKTACSRFPATAKAKCEASQKRKVASLKTAVDRMAAQNNKLQNDLGKC